MNSYTNPIIPGFYPDPSVCRVGEDYYLVTSSFEYFPGVPIFHSRDMVNWRQIGHCLTRPEQLDLEKCGVSAGIFAPTIRYHQGRFYMITTIVHDRPHIYVWAEDPAGPWSDPIRIDQSGIDPSFCFDEEGVCYVSSTGRDENGQAVIVQSTIDIETGRIIEPTRPVWRGTGGAYPEAPHLFRIDGVWYLMLAEGGTNYGHMVTIGRSDSAWGPFESAPHNPILSHRSQTAPMHCTGHADLVQDHRGGWWLVFLATRNIPRNNNCHHLGRETFLAPVTWEDGWPVVNGGETVSLEMEAEALPLYPAEAPPARDDFDAAELALQWNFLRNPRASDASLSERPGFLRLCGSAVTLNDLDSPAWVGRRQQHFTCRFSAKLDFSPSANHEEAGLTVLMNNRHHYDLGIHATECGRSVFVRQRIGPLEVIVAEEEVADGACELLICAQEDEYTFFCNGEPLPATGEARYLSAEVAKGFTGVYLAMYATGNGVASNEPADFDWCEYLPE